MAVKTCVVCGIEFDGHPRSCLCSDNCRARRQNSYHPPRPKHMKKCLVCGSYYLGPPHRKYCSDKCRCSASYDRSPPMTDEQKERAKIKQRKRYAKSHPSPAEIQCTCGKSFKAGHWSRKYCSDKCKNKARREDPLRKAKRREYQREWERRPENRAKAAERARGRDRTSQSAWKANNPDKVALYREIELQSRRGIRAARLRLEAPVVEVHVQVKVQPSAGQCCICGCEFLPKSSRHLTCSKDCSRQRHLQMKNERRWRYDALGVDFIR